MTKVFNFLYANEKSKKYIIFSLIAIYCCLVLFQSTSLFKMENSDVLARDFKILLLCFSFVIALYLLADILTCKVKIGWPFIALGVLFAISFIKSGNGQLLTILAFIYLLKQYNFKEFFKVVFYFIFALFFSILILSLFSVIPDIVGLRLDVVRHTLGFDCSTITQSIYMFIILVSAYIYKTKLKWFTLLMQLEVATILYFLTDSRAGYYLSLFIILVVCICKIFNYFNLKERFSKWRISNFIKTSTNVVLCSFPLIIVCAFTVLVVLYPYGSEIILKINNLLSGRLSLANNAINDYGITLFGVSKENMPNIFVDNSFYYFIFAYGIINTLIILCFSIYFLWYSLKKKDYWLTFAGIIVLIDSFIEPCLVAYQYNLFVFALVGMFDGKELWYGIKTKVKETCDMQGKNFTAVVVTYNRKELLKECVQALQNQTYKDLNILIVDNASTDGTKEYISSLLNKKTEYINTGANLGGAGGFNFGISKAVENGADYVWIMDDDCIPNVDALQNLIDYGTQVKGDFGFLSSKVLWKDNSICAMNVQRTSIGQEVKNFDVAQKIKMASFVSIMLNVNAVEKVGLPIKDFFIWGDDGEYTYRISNYYNCYFVPQSMVIHKSSNNVGSNIAKDESDRLGRYFYAYRNEGYFYSKQGLSGWIYFFVKKQLHKMRILFSNAKNKKQKFAIMKKGCKAVKSFKPAIEYVYRPTTQVNVLECFAEPLAYGGQEAFIINMYKNFTQNQLKYTFFTPFELTNQNLINLAKERNEEILHDDKKFNSKLRKVHIKNSYKNLFANNNFDVVHIHSGSVWALLTISKLAKIYGVKKVIIHSHCTGKANIVYKLIKKHSDKNIKKYVDDFCACSNLAAEWKFPKDIIQDKKYTIINNGIDIENFKFNSQERKEYRKQFNLGKSLVLCNVGRLSEMKNQMFSIDVAKQLKDKGIDFKFFLVGEGELKEQIVDKINKLGLQDNFIMLEKRNDVAQIMMASDLFVLPSLFEGFPVVGIEAQATGLKTLCSNTITTEVNITDLCEQLPLDVNTWVQKIEQIACDVKDRAQYAKVVSNAGYNSKESAELLEKIYLEK